MNRQHHLKGQPEIAQRDVRGLRIQKVLDKTGLSRTQIYRLIGRGLFPRPHHLSERIVAWDAADVDAWLADKFGNRGAK